MPNVSLDPTSGNVLHIEEHRGFVSLVDDVAYFTIMVIVFDYTGLNRFFIQLPEIMSDNPYLIQALRYGLMFGTLAELRRWLEEWGLNTDVSHYLDSVLNTVR